MARLLRRQLARMSKSRRTAKRRLPALLSQHNRSVDRQRKLAKLDRRRRPGLKEPTAAKPVDPDTERAQLLDEAIPAGKQK